MTLGFVGTGAITAARRHVGVGLFDAVCRRGKHIGRPLFTAIGICCLVAVALAQ